MSGWVWKTLQEACRSQGLQFHVQKQGFTESGVLEVFVRECSTCFTERFRIVPSVSGDSIVSTLVSTLDHSRPGIALVSISRLRTLCETVAPRYAEGAKFFSVREGYGAAVTALQAYIDAGTVDVVLAAKCSQRFRPRPATRPPRPRPRDRP